MNMQPPFWGLPSIVGVQVFTLAGIVTIISIVVQVAFCFGVLIDASKQEALDTGPLFAKPWVWGLAVLVGGLPMLAFYWLIHYSTLRR